MAEPVLVVESREHLWYLLNEASQLEHMIMCQYLYATFSLKLGSDEGLSEEQATAVARWRRVLHDICVDEMLHLALVANVMSSIGAAPTVSRPNFPQRSGYFPPTVQLDLLRFDEAALTHFRTSNVLRAWKGWTPKGSCPRHPRRSRDDLIVTSSRTGLRTAQEVAVQLCGHPVPSHRRPRSVNDVRQFFTSGFTLQLHRRLHPLTCAYAFADRRHGRQGSHNDPSPWLIDPWATSR